VCALITAHAEAARAAASAHQGGAAAARYGGSASHAVVASAPWWAVVATPAGLPQHHTQTVRPTSPVLQPPASHGNPHAEGPRTGARARLRGLLICRNMCHRRAGPLMLSVGPNGESLAMRPGASIFWRRRSRSSPPPQVAGNILVMKPTRIPVSAAGIYSVPCLLPEPLRVGVRACARAGGAGKLCLCS